MHILVGMKLKINQAHVHDTDTSEGVRTFIQQTFNSRKINAPHITINHSVATPYEVSFNLNYIFLAP